MTMSTTDIAQRALYVLDTQGLATSGEVWAHETGLDLEQVEDALDLLVEAHLAELINNTGRMARGRREFTLTQAGRELRAVACYRARNALITTTFSKRT